MFLSTCGGILRNPGVQPVPALMRHAAWHAVRRMAPLPLEVELTDRSRLLLTRREEMNGSVALVWSQRLYDYHNMTFLRALLKADFARVCFDVGANVGIYSLLMSEMDSVTVHAFEPHPATHTTLERILRFNHRSNAHAWKIALSDTPGSLRFTDDDCSTVNQALDSTQGEVPSITVPAETGRDFCERHQVIPEIIKVDTEGFETRVLHGFGSLLNKTRLIFAEMNAPAGEVAAALPSEVFDGPLYVDHTRRLLCRLRHNHEDAVFVNRSALPDLNSLGYRVETPRE